MPVPDNLDGDGRVALGRRSCPAIEDWTLLLLPVTVTRVVDGDTIKVVLDGLEVTVRLIGVDTPETVHPAKAVEAYGKKHRFHSPGS